MKLRDIVMYAVGLIAFIAIALYLLWKYAFEKNGQEAPIGPSPIPPTTEPIPEPEPGPEPAPTPSSNGSGGGSAGGGPPPKITEG